MALTGNNCYQKEIDMQTRIARVYECKFYNGMGEVVAVFNSTDAQMATQLVEQHKRAGYTAAVTIVTREVI
jgi:uncharacterized protein YodC (DUF2158 family)